MNGRDTLKDLPCVEVVVQFRSRAGEAGFSEQPFQTDVELKLRMAGIRVATGDVGSPWLYVNVNALHRETDRLGAYSVSLELIQHALLRSQLGSDVSSSEHALAKITTRATTWSARVLGFGDVADARDAVRDLVNDFVNDWLAVNPPNRTA